MTPAIQALNRANPQFAGAISAVAGEQGDLLLLRVSGRQWPEAIRPKWPNGSKAEPAAYLAAAADGRLAAAITAASTADDAARAMIRDAARRIAGPTAPSSLDAGEAGNPHGAAGSSSGDGWLVD